MVVGIVGYSGRELFLKITEVFFGIKAVANSEVIENQKSLSDIVLIRGVNVTTPLFEEILYQKAPKNMAL